MRDRILVYSRACDLGAMQQSNRAVVRLPLLDLRRPHQVRRLHLTWGETRARRSAGTAFSLAKEGVPLPLQVAGAGYHEFAKRAAARLEGTWVRSTRDKRHRIADELASFLAQNAVATGGRSLANCMPRDITAFMEWWWVRHAGSRGVDGSPLASPGAVRGAISHLSTYFEQIGRSGPYEVATGRGNPAKGFDARCYARAYARFAHHSGFESASAVPFTSAKVTRLLQYLDAEIAVERRPDQQWVLLQDAALVCYCWCTGQRGGDGGRLLQGDLRASPVARVPLALPLAPFPAVGSRLHIVPFKTKTSQARRAPPVSLTVYGRGALFCFASRLDHFIRLSVATGRFVADPYSPLFSSSRSEGPVTANALNSRLICYLTAINAYEGESSHSFRRGSLQTVHAAGAPLSTVAAHGQIRTASTLARYLHPTSHAKRLRVA